MSRPVLEATMLAGAAVVDITPPLPVDVLGYVRRATAPRRLRSPLQARAVDLVQQLDPALRPVHTHDGQRPPHRDRRVDRHMHEAAGSGARGGLR